MKVQSNKNWSLTRTICAALLCVGSSLALAANAPGATTAPASTYAPSPENLEARAWFQGAKFGVHPCCGVERPLAHRRAAVESIR